MRKKRSSGPRAMSRAREADNVALHANAERLVNTDKVRPGLIAQQELDDATAKDRASQAQVDAAKSALAAAKQQLEVAKADQQHYSALSDYARITAPYDGVVTWRFSDTGALVQAGTSNTSGLPVVTVAQVDVLRLRIPVPESLAAKVRIGDSADVHVQATGEHFTGKVARFTDALDPSTRTMQVEIDVPNPSYHLQPGMYADVTWLRANSAQCADHSDLGALQRGHERQHRAGGRCAEPCAEARGAGGHEELEQRARFLSGLDGRRPSHYRQSRQLSRRARWCSPRRPPR